MIVDAGVFFDGKGFGFEWHCNNNTRFVHCEGLMAWLIWKGWRSYENFFFPSTNCRVSSVLYCFVLAGVWMAGMADQERGQRVFGRKKPQRTSLPCFWCLQEILKLQKGKKHLVLGGGFIFCLFSPLPWGNDMFQFDYSSIFQLGWNHQLVVPSTLTGQSAVVAVFAASKFLRCWPIETEGVSARANWHQRKVGETSDHIQPDTKAALRIAEVLKIKGSPIPKSLMFFTSGQNNGKKHTKHLCKSD